ncbi:MAG: rod shape-determining protein RodA [Limnochordaceae bacterium]|nr:rod shape-determining protein RodA [Limnochordaceae bacterium]
MIERRQLRYLDWYLLGSVLALVGVGLLMIYSATYRGLPGIRVGPYYFVVRQLSWAIIGGIAGAAALVVDYRRWPRWSRGLYVIMLLLLMAVLASQKISGASSWLRFGALGFQPSEPAKLIFVVVLASYLEKNPPDDTARELVAPFLIAAPPLVLILLQPDFGTALVFAGILLGMLFAAGAKPWRLGAVVGSGVLVGVVAAYLVLHGVDLKVVHPYQVQRLLAFLNPYHDPTRSGYNVIQSMIAVGSGQLTGKGLFAGSQTQLSFLPARHTDFIFSVIGEELGFLGTTAVLGLFFLLIWRSLGVARVAKDPLGANMAAGVTSMFLTHLVVNVGMTLGVMPVTGIPLPFISYGGSSLLTNLLGVGILLNVQMRRLKILF